jgi:transposase
MFIREKQNKSGKVSIQIIEKRSGKYKVLQTIGCSGDVKRLSELKLQANNWIKGKLGIQEFDFTNYHSQTHQVLDGIESLTNAGLELLLGKLFDEIGFNAIKDKLFRQLTLSRIANPVSKLKTTDYLYKYHSLDIDVQTIYRYLDKLYNKQKETVQKISYNHTLGILDNKISVVFYDVTTIYFEIEAADELRKTGFSKEGKHQNPQIVLGLLVSKNGYPLTYDIFEGNKFEGHTMMPIIKGFKEKYTLEKLLVVADAGLLSNANILELEENGFEYILGGKLKNASTDIKQAVLALSLENGQSAVITDISKGNTIVVSFSTSRARKDAHNRERGIEKLKKQISSGKLTKENINNRGYNKFLEIASETDIKVKLNESKVQEDGKWDGLKGYITNTKLSNEEVIENYSHLWQIEKAFRVTKTDLKVRPMFHRAKRRIEAHICITFAAYKIYKELDRQLKLKKSDLSPEKAIDIAKTIMSIKVQHPVSKEIFHKTLFLNEEQKALAKLFGF